jgi:hypothetical protein
MFMQWNNNSWNLLEQKNDYEKKDIDVETKKLERS